MTVASALSSASSLAEPIGAIRGAVRDLIESATLPSSTRMRVLTKDSDAGSLRAARPGQSLDPSDLVEAISGIEKLKNSLDALQSYYEVALRDERIRTQQEAGLPKAKLGSGVGDEVALARGISPSRASRQLALRRVIVETLPGTWKRMAEGDVSAWTAEEVASSVFVLDDEDRLQIDQELAPVLHELSPRTAGSRARARADALDQEAALARIRRNHTQRHVSQRPAAEGMMRLSVLLPLHTGVAAFAALSAAADSARAQGDERSRGQVMADELAERVTGTPGAIIPVEIQLLMTDRTLLAGASDAAELEGQAIPGSVARHLALTGDLIPQVEPRSSTTDAHDATGQHPAAPDPSVPRWIRRLYADPVTGELESMDTRKRLFSGAVRRFVIARDRQCRTPGCEAAPRHVHHVERYADGGLTTPSNAAALCERFNYVAELPGWGTQAGPGSGELTITTPTGHTHVSPVPSLWERVGRPDGPGQGHTAIATATATARRSRGRGADPDDDPG